MDNIKSFVFLERFKKGMSFAVALAVICQNIFFFSFANSFGSVLVLVAWALTYKIVMQSINFLQYSLSTFIVFGFYFTQFCLPVIFTLLEGKPLIYNLYFPISVFIHSFLAFLVLLVSFIIYKNHLTFLRKILTNFLGKLRIYEVPTGKQFWLMGIIGILSMVAVKIFFGGIGQEKTEHVFLKFLAGMEHFSYMPLLLLFPAIITDTKNIKHLKSSQILIILYTVALIIIGIMANLRGLFMEGVTTIGLIYFLGLILGKMNYQIITPKKLFLILSGMWLLTGPLAELGTAMVVVRGVRGDLPPKVLLEETIRTYQNKEAIRKYNELIDYKIGEWDERYFDNIFLTRFSNLKYTDASLQLAFHLPNPDKQIQDVVWGKYLSTLPQPILNGLEININKTYYTEASFGDFLFMRKTGGGYGGFRVGNFMGLGLASFGWWYLGILFASAIILYNFVDSFILKTGHYSSKISIVGFLSILFCFTYFGNSTSSESVTTIFNFILRGWFQTVLLYIILFWIARKVSKIL